MRATVVCCQRLAFEVMAPPLKNAAPKTVVFMHGIMGNKKNLRTLAREFLKLRPTYQAVLIDHRGHGESIALKINDEASVADCAMDLAETFASTEFKEQALSHLPSSSASAFAPDILCAHSFGGKVALEFLRRQQSPASRSSLHDMWILDSSPFPYPSELNVADPTQSVHHVLQSLLRAPRAFATRAAATEYLTQESRLPLSIAQWLCSTMIAAPLPNNPGQQGVAVALDLPIVQRLFQDFAHLDYSSFLSSHAAQRPSDKTPTTIHFLRAERNTLWETTGSWQRLQSIASVPNGPEQGPSGDSVTTGQRKTSDSNIELLTLAGVGHWLHAEKPGDVAGLIHRHSLNL